MYLYYQISCSFNTRWHLHSAHFSCQMPPTWSQLTNKWHFRIPAHHRSLSEFQSQYRRHLSETTPTACVHITSAYVLHSRPKCNAKQRTKIFINNSCRIIVVESEKTLSVSVFLCSDARNPWRCRHRTILSIWQSGISIAIITCRLLQLSSACHIQKRNEFPQTRNNPDVKIVTRHGSDISLSVIYMIHC